MDVEPEFIEIKIVEDEDDCADECNNTEHCLVYTFYDIEPVPICYLLKTTGYHLIN